MQVVTLYIKNMICLRCIQQVEDLFLELGHEVFSVKSGEIVLGVAEPDTDFSLANKELQKIGFEIIPEQDRKLIDAIKETLSESIRKQDFSKNLEEMLKPVINHSYEMAEKIFFKKEMVSLEKYYQLLRLDLSKDLLANTNKTIRQTGLEAGFDNTPQFYRIFENTFGISPSRFRIYFHTQDDNA
jgi:AraC-like DNA-binding protein